MPRRWHRCICVQLKPWQWPLTPITDEHVTRFRLYAIEIGKELGSCHRSCMPSESFGRCGILASWPSLSTSSPNRGKLTREEFEKMKIDPVVGGGGVGYVFLIRSGLRLSARITEKWDGSGYPDGLQGEAIPIGAQKFGGCGLPGCAWFRSSISDASANAMCLVPAESGSKS